MKVTVKGKEYELENLHITGVSSDEKEVTSTNCAVDEAIHIYTSDDSYLTKFKKLILSNPDEWKITRVMERKDGTISGVSLDAPKEGLLYRAKKPAVVLTEEQRRIRSERMKILRSSSFE